MRVAVIQQAPRRDPADSAARQFELVSEAAAQGARLVVLPEGGLSGLAMRHTEALAAAQDLDGAYVEALRSLSSSLQVAIVANLYERGDLGGRPVAHNTSVLVDRGEVLGAYRKIHLFDAQRYCESASVEPGDPGQLRAAPPVVEGVAVGLETCFDIRFAEQAIALARHGAALLCVPAAWVAGPHKRTQWDTLLRARAIETGCYVAGAAQPGPNYAGGSAIYGPEGDPVSRVLGGDEEGLALGDVDPQAVARARATTPTLRHRPAWGAR